MRRKISTKKIAAARSGRAQWPGVCRAKTMKKANRKPKPQPKNVRASVMHMDCSSSQMLIGLKKAGSWLRTCSMSEDLCVDPESPAPDPSQRQAGHEGDNDIEAGRHDEGFQVAVILRCQV